MDSTVDVYRRGENARVDAAISVLSGGGALLDVGCGAGILLGQVKDRYESVRGVDISAKAVSMAQMRGIRAEVVNLNEQRLPFHDQTFKVVCLLAVLQFMDDPNWALQECFRVLQPGAALLVSVPNMRAGWRIARLVVNGTFPRSSKDAEGYDGRTLHYFASKDLGALLRNRGFRVIRARGIFCRPRFLEGRWDRGALGALKREFFSGEIFVETVRGGGATARAVR